MLAAHVLVIASCASPVLPSPDHARDEGACVPLTDPVLIGPTTSITGTSRLSPAVGLVNGHVLLEWSVEWPSDPDRGARVFVQWLDGALQPDGGPISLGNAPVGQRSRWVALDGALSAQVWSTGDDAVAAGRMYQSAAIWRVEPPGGAPPLRVAVAVPVTPPGPACPDCSPVTFGGIFYEPGAQLLLPSARADGSPAFVVSAIPSACMTNLASGMRSLVFDATRAIPVRWDDPCDSSALAPAAANNWIFDLDHGVGLLFRRGYGGEGGRMYYTRLDESFVPTGPPILVGLGPVPSETDGGYQPRAVAVGGDRALFTERVDSGLNRCQVVGLMTQQGESSALAPWQMPCYFGDRVRLTESSELVELADGRAVLAWGERPNFALGHEFAQRLTLSTEWDEGIYLAMIASDGYRASPIVRVTDDAATAVDWSSEARTETLGPFPGDFLVSAASDGDEVAVVWTDLRADAPGYYGRLFRCAATAH
jgi:hypothetical protein